MVCDEGKAVIDEHRKQGWTEGLSKLAPPLAAAVMRMLVPLREALSSLSAERFEWHGVFGLPILCVYPVIAPYFVPNRAHVSGCLA